MISICILYLNRRICIFIRVADDISDHLREAVFIRMNQALRNRASLHEISCVMFPDKLCKRCGRKILTGDIQLPERIKRSAQQIAREQMDLFGFGADAFDLALEIGILCPDTEQLADQLDAGYRRFDIVAERSDHFLFALFECRFPLSCGAQLLAHDIEAFGKCAEEIVLLCQQRLI